jgi:hypothetical protein
VIRVLFLAAAVLAAAMAPASAQDTPAARATAAERYADLMEVDKATAEAIQDYARNVRPDRRDAFVQHMNRTVDQKKIRAAAVSAMVQVFTLEELNAAVAFWSSPAGRSMIGKLPKYQAASAPAMLAELDRAAATFK